MKEKIESIQKELDSKLSNIKTLAELNEARVNYIGKKGEISALSQMMSTLSSDEKKEFGIKVNELRNKVNDALDMKKKEIDDAILNEKLK